MYFQFVLGYFAAVYWKQCYKSLLYKIWHLFAIFLFFYLRIFKTLNHVGVKFVTFIMSVQHQPRAPLFTTASIHLHYKTLELHYKCISRALDVYYIVLNYNYTWSALQMHFNWACCALHSSELGLHYTSR